MGDMADDILDGWFCQVCGAVMEDAERLEKAPGYPRTCKACIRDQNDRRPKKRGHSKKTQKKPRQS